MSTIHFNRSPYYFVRSEEPLAYILNTYFDREYRFPRNMRIINQEIYDDDVSIDTLMETTIGSERLVCKKISIRFSFCPSIRVYYVDNKLVGIWVKYVDIMKSSPDQVINLFPDIEKIVARLISNFESPDLIEAILNEIPSKI